MRLKNLFTGFAFVAVTLVSAPVAANSLVFQGVTFETIASDSTHLTLNITGALDSATGNWANITAMKAFEIKDIGYVTGAIVDSTNTTADPTWTAAQRKDNWVNSGGGVTASALGCSGGGSSQDCFAAASPVTVTESTMTWNLIYNSSQDFSEPHLKVQFLLSPNSLVKQGSLLSMAVPVPEPEIYAMMIAGLGLLGFVARRRRAGLSV